MSLLLTPAASPYCYLCFWLKSYKWEVPTTPSLGSINLLKWLTELREAFYLLNHQFVMQGQNSGTAWLKSWVGQRRGEEGTDLPCPSSPTLAPYLQVFTNQKLPWVLSFGVSIKALLHKLIKPLTFHHQSTPAPLLSQEVGGGGGGRQLKAPLIMWLAPLGNQALPQAT